MVADLPPRPAGARPVMRWVMSLFYIVAGILHLAIPDRFLLIVPAWVPHPDATIAFTGVCEIAGGLALLIGRTERAAGVMLAVYAICVFPANVKHALEHVQVPGMPDGWWYHGPRLAFQPVLVWWALFCSSVVDWPARRRSRHPRGRAGPS